MLPSCNAICQNLAFYAKYTTKTFNSSAGAYVTKNSDGAYLGQNSGQNSLKEWSEHKMKAILELSTLENPV